MTQNKNISLLLALLIFIFLYYYHLIPFKFGSSANLEELPIIYKLIGLADYPNDEYVKSFTSTYTQVTPYVTFIALISKLFHTQDLAWVYLILHMITLALIYISIRQIFKQTSDLNDTFILISILLLLFFTESVHIIPNLEWLFYEFMDPEFITYPFLYLTIFFFINKNYFSSYLSLFIATLFHPLYAIPLLFGLLTTTFIQNFRKRTNKKKYMRICIFYILSVIPYSIFVWSTSHQTITSQIDPSMVLEVIRAPNQTKIPTLFSFDRTTMFFYSYVFILGVISFLLSNGRKYLSENLNTLTIINYLLVSYLVIISLISTIHRFPTLVFMTPYRIGVIIVVLTWVIFFTSLASRFNELNNYFHKRCNFILSFCLILVSLLSVICAYIPSKPQEGYKDKLELIRWIKENTRTSDLFLNYSDIDVRTSAYRADYFNFQMFPLTANSQISWYKQYLIYFDISDSINPGNYMEIDKHAKSSHKIDISRVVNKSNAPIKFILFSKDKKSFSGIADLLGLKSNNYTYELKSYKKIFENKNYEIYSVY